MAFVIFIFICIFIKEVQTYWYFGRRDSTRVGVESGGWQLQSGGGGGGGGGEEGGGGGEEGGGGEGGGWEGGEGWGQIEIPSFQLFQRLQCTVQWTFWSSKWDCL